MSVRSDGYESALQDALELLKDARQESEKRGILSKVCGAAHDSSGFQVEYYGTPVTINLRDMTVGSGNIKLSEQVLIAHYLTGPLQNFGTEEMTSEWVTFKQLPGASFYNPAYRKQGPGIGLSVFGSQPQGLVRAGKKMNGRIGEFGDYSVILRPFPAIEAVPVFYLGDDELPPDMEILYRNNITRFFSLEDVVVLSRTLVLRLAKAAEE